jgi:transcriptional regulator PpsR
MTDLTPRTTEGSFRAPSASLGALDADVAARVIAAAADIALVIDRDGIVRDLSIGGVELANEGFEAWLGQRWIDTVSSDTREKIEALLREGRGGSSRWRQVNHTTARGEQLPVLYHVVPLGHDDRVVAVGREMRAVASLQQRLVSAQQSMEREYSRLRHAETRYRMLFQIASEAVLIIEAATMKVVEANPAAANLLGIDEKRAGRSVTGLFDQQGAAAVELMLTTVRATGRADDVEITLARGAGRYRVSASLFRQDNVSHVLMRLSPVEAHGGAITLPKAQSKLIQVVENLPDGFVITDLNRRVLTVNTAFLDLAQLGTEEQARGETLERWLGRSGVDLDVLAVNLREHGSVRNFATVLRGEYGSTEEVEVSAVAVLSGEQPCLGFMIRNVGRRSVVEFRADRNLSQSVSHLTDLVGRVALKDLVREATDVIERLCIEAALEQTRDNRASAAEMLGMSRQSLYAKLRRYGLGDLDSDDDI